MSFDIKDINEALKEKRLELLVEFPWNQYRINRIIESTRLEWIIAFHRALIKSLILINAYLNDETYVEFEEELKKRKFEIKEDLVAINKAY